MIEYKLLSKQYLKQTVTLINTYFGSNFITPTTAVDYIDNKSKYCVIAINNNLVIGCLFAQLDNTNNFPALTEFQNLKVLHRKHTVVNKSFQRKGIAQSLWEFLLINVKQNFDLSVSYAWMYNSKIPIEKHLLTCGFHQYAIIHNYWYNDSIEQQYSCIVCGNTCRCSAILFIKHFV